MKEVDIKYKQLLEDIIKNSTLNDFEKENLIKGTSKN